MNKNYIHQYSQISGIYNGKKARVTYTMIQKQCKAQKRAKWKILMLQTW